MVKSEVFSLECNESFEEPKSVDTVIIPKKDKVSIFKVHNKRSERSPDLEGDFTLGGSKYKLVLWTRKTKYGNEFFTGYVNHSSE